MRNDIPKDGESLGDLFPDLLLEWDYSKNSKLDPFMLKPGSHKPVYWICKKCGNKWPAEIRMRAQHNQGCGKCSKEKQVETFRENLIASGRKTLAEAYPEIAEEWHPTKNKGKRPTDFTASSDEEVWWKGMECGHEWPATINNRTGRKSGCPFCAGRAILPGFNDLQTLFPSLAREWHPTKNLPRKANEVAPFSHDKVWWICRFGHEYQCRIADRQKGVGCSECSKRFRTSLPEKIVEYYIRQRFFDTISNYRPEWLDGAEIDIFIPSISTGIEYDGQRYHQDIQRDQNKDEICHRNGIRLIRVREKKCPQYNRDDPSFVLENQGDTCFSQAILSILQLFGITDVTVNIKRDKQAIMEVYHNTAISGSIAELYPELAKEWHPTANGGLKPENIPATKTKEPFSWKCKICGYPWEAALSERINGTGCPACAGKVVVPGFNDLATTHPMLAKEWHPTKNGEITPQTVSKGMDDLVWWRCSKCGHEWPARIKKRVSGTGCERCARKARGEKQYKKVFQFSPQGNLIKDYPSAKIAAKEIGISRVAIQHVCSGIGRLKSAGGFLWSYYEDGRIEQRLEGQESSSRSKRVVQYSKDGQLIKEYENAKQAAIEVNISEVSIRHACNKTNGAKTAGGYVWNYK